MRYVCLLFLFLIVFSCKKESKPAPVVVPATLRDSAFDIAQLLIWSGRQHHYCPQCIPAIDTTYPIADTFQVTVIDTAHLVFTYTSYTPYDTLYFSTLDSAAGTMVFNTWVQSPVYNASVVFYYLTDSAIYSATQTNLIYNTDTVTEQWVTTLSSSKQ